MSKYIGTYADDGSIRNWPECNIEGAGYEKVNANRVSIGGGRFVVVPINYEDTDGKLEGYRTRYDENEVGDVVSSDPLFIGEYIVTDDDDQ